MSTKVPLSIKIKDKLIDRFAQRRDYNMDGSVSLTSNVKREHLDVGHGTHFRGDFGTVLQLWRPLAEEGNACAQYNLGTRYALGQEVALNYAEAVKWYRRAAKQGYTDAQFSLAVMYLHGKGVPQDNAKAILWFRQAAKRGNVDAQSSLVFLRKGRGEASLEARVRSMSWWRRLTAR